MRLLQDLADREINFFKVGLDEPEIATGQTRQNKIGLAVCHSLSPLRGKSAAHLSAVRALEIADDRPQ